MSRRWPASVILSGFPGLPPVHWEARPEMKALVYGSADTLEDGERNACNPFVTRLSDNAWPLALVLHAIHHAPDASALLLEKETASAAVKIARWFFTETTALLHAKFIPFFCIPE